MVYGADILFDFDHFDGLFDIFDRLHLAYVPPEDSSEMQSESISSLFENGKKDT